MRKRQLQFTPGSDRGTASRRRHLGNFLLLGRQHVETGNWPEAIRLLLRALECDPHSVEALRMLAGVELSRGDAVAAQQYLSRALALAPDDAENLFLQGNLALNAQDAPTALTAYTRALDLGGATPELSYNCALAHLMLGHGAPAAALLIALLDEQPENARAHDALGCAQHQQKKYNAARDSFLHALDIDPTLQEARDHLAQLLLETGKPRQAQQVLETALTMAPDRPTTRHLLGMACAGAGDYAGAVAQWEALLAAGHDTPETRYLLANAYLSLQERANALRTLHALVAAWPSHLGGQLQLAVLLLEDGDYTQGWHHLTHARTLDPGNPAVLRLLSAAQLLAPQPPNNRK